MEFSQQTGAAVTKADYNDIIDALNALESPNCVN